MKSAALRSRTSVLYPVRVTSESLSRRITVANRATRALKERDNDVEFVAKEFKTIKSAVGRGATGVVVVVVGAGTGELIGALGGLLGAGGAFATVVVVVGGLVDVVVGGLEEPVGLYSVTQSTSVDAGAVGHANPDSHHVCCWMSRPIG
jgi:hypothetical protein